MKDRCLALKVGPSKFSGVSYDSILRGLVFGWQAETEVPNVVYLRLFCLALRWPPVSWPSAFIVGTE